MAQVRKCDVVIAGAGPAGAAAAARLVAAGLETVVLERSSPEGRSPCGGVLSPLAQARVASILGKAAHDMDMYSDAFTGLNFHFPSSGNAFTASFKQGPARRVTRPRLDNLLMEASGAEVFSPMEVVSINNATEHLEVHARGPEGQSVYHCRALIGADGAGSTVRGLVYTGLDTGPVFRALRTLHRVIDNPLDPSYVHVWPDTRFGLLAWAHAWGERMVVGLLRQEGQDVSELHDELMERLEEDHGVRLAPPDESADGRVFIGPAITNHYILGKGRIVLTGEAAGFINPPLEGLSTALSTGAIAGDSVAKALKEGSEPSLVYRDFVAEEARNCTDMWNATRLLFGSPHEADIRAGFNSMSQDAQHAVGNDLMRYMKMFKKYGWGWRMIWQGLVRLVLGRYPG
ncbi:MAG: FAD-dependent monooxygenase [Thermodesulfovibrionales bacterium]|nr:FAD-dependent monooxygenase [Thermodesulfovibrionales bacterium]